LDRGFNFYDNFPEHVKSKSRWGRIERRGMDVAQRTEHRSAGTYCRNTSEAAGYLQRAYELRPQDPTIALAYSEALERNHELPQAREVPRDQLEISS
jgi:hypothetical protein